MLQRSNAKAQRSRKRQPVGQAVALGTEPGITVRRSRGAPRRGIAASSPSRVRMHAVDANSVRTGASSTICPAYITITRCARSAITPRSCVMSSTAMPTCALQRREQLEDLRLDRDVERRRGLVRDEERGLEQSAIASITRWRMPPESWCG